VGSRQSSVSSKADDVCDGSAQAEGEKMKMIIVVKQEASQ
jgi:hypothetical protein